MLTRELPLEASGEHILRRLGRIKPPETCCSRSAAHGFKTVTNALSPCGNRLAANTCDRSGREAREAGAGDPWPGVSGT
jgi:hypothetical protein